MPSKNKLVAVRLTPSELAELRKLPGESSTGRLRMLLHASGATDGLAAKIAQEVTKEVTALHAKSLAATEKKIQALEGKIHEEFGAVIRRLIEKMNQLSLGQKK